MADIIPLLNTLPTSIAPVDVELFDPPLCCPTGICGPALDQTLLDVNEMIMSLQRDNLRVERYQMTSHPNAFLSNAEVMKLVREKQMEALPIIVVRGKVIKVGAYPSADEIRNCPHPQSFPRKGKGARVPSPSGEGEGRRQP